MKATLREIHHAIKTTSCVTVAAKALGTDRGTLYIHLAQAGLSYDVLNELDEVMGPATFGVAYDRVLTRHLIDLKKISFPDLYDAVFKTGSVAEAAYALGVRPITFSTHLGKMGIDYDELKASDKPTALARWGGSESSSVEKKADLTRYTLAEIHAIIRATETATDAGRRLGGVKEQILRSQLARMGCRYALLKEWDEATARERIPTYDEFFQCDKTVELDNLPLPLIHEVILETDSVTGATINLGVTTGTRLQRVLVKAGLSYELLKGLDDETAAVRRLGRGYFSSLKDYISDSPQPTPGKRERATSPLESPACKQQRSASAREVKEDDVAGAASLGQMKYGFLSPLGSPFKPLSAAEIASALEVAKRSGFYSG